MKIKRGFSKYLVLIIVLLFFVSTAGIGNATSSSILIVAGGASSGTDPTAIKYTGIVTNGTVITKPTCTAGLDARVFVIPVQFIGGISTTIVDITGVSTYAVDNGTTWTVIGQIKDSSATTYTTAAALQLLVLARCCTTGTNCE